MLAQSCRVIRMICNNLLPEKLDYVGECFLCYYVIIKYYNNFNSLNDCHVISQYHRQSISTYTT